MENRAHFTSVAHGGLEVEHPDFQEGGEGLAQLALRGGIQLEEFGPILIDDCGRVVPVAEIPVEVLGKADDLFRVELRLLGQGRPGLERGSQPPSRRHTEVGK